MGKITVWQDEYWLLLMQIYLKRPVGVKPLYARDVVDLSMELHIAPQMMQAKMQQIARLETPLIERIWQTYGQNPRKLARAVRLWREMKGFGMAQDFYQGVAVQETFEKDFRPLDEDKRFLPVSLVLVLDVYFRLTTITMVPDTPDVQELARLLKLKPTDVVEVLQLFQTCDPYLNRSIQRDAPLLQPCRQIWQRYGNEDPERLAAYAEELKEYFK